MIMIHFELVTGIEPAVSSLQERSRSIPGPPANLAHFLARVEGFEPSRDGFGDRPTQPTLTHLFPGWPYWALAPELGPMPIGVKGARLDRSLIRLFILITRSHGSLLSRLLYTIGRKWTVIEPPPEVLPPRDDP